MKWWKAVHLMVVLGLVQSLTVQPAIAEIAQGGKTLEQLRGGGEYESLFDAFNKARYKIHSNTRVDKENFWAQTPAHGLHSRFDQNGLQLTAQASQSEKYHSDVRLVSLGYGQALHVVEPGKVSSHGNRISIDRSLVSEWYINRSTGLEQGFTLPERPSGYKSGENLQLVLSVDGDLVPTSSADGQSVLLLNSDSNEVLQYAGLKVWDSSGKSFEASMNAKDQQVIIQVADIGATYPLTIDPTYTQQAYIKASNPGSSDYFGFSVDVSGDSAVIGAYRESSNSVGVNGDETNNSASVSGAAYVFTRSAGVWSQQAYLKASNTEANDHFGYAVGIDGDTIVVGAYQEDSNSTSVNGVETDNSSSASGAAYVFTRSAGVWSQAAYLKAANADANDYFGYAVDVSGNTVVVGAYLEDGVTIFDPSLNLSNGSGAAYVFTSSGGAWSQQAYLKASNIGTSDQFGYSVAASGDSVVIGAVYEDSNAVGVNGDGTNNSLSRPGAAYVFKRTGVAWSQEAYLKASNTGSSDEFGFSVAIDGDSVIVGARYEDGNGEGLYGDPTDNSASNSGAAYTFGRSGAVWSPEAYLKASNTEANDYFGWSVAVSGSKAIVGAYVEDSVSTGIDGDQSDNTASGSGAAYAYVNDSGWAFQSYIKASNASGSDYFGHDVAISGDTVLVGAYLEDSSSTGVNGDETLNNLSNSGAAYMINMPTPAYPYAVCGNITGSNHTFNFVNNGSVSTERSLEIGSSSGGNDIYSSFSLTGPAANATTHQVSGLPTDGRIVYLTLYSTVSGTLDSEETTCYTATFSAPRVYAPVPGSVITGNSMASETDATIKWDDGGTPVTSYWLYVGSTLGGREIYNSGDLGTVTSDDVIDIPANGRAVYVRLWYSLDDGLNWNYRDVTYRSRNNDNGPYLTDPAPGSALGDGSHVVWVDDGPNDSTDRYRVYAGPTYASSTWTFSGNIAYDQRSYAIGGWSASDYGKTVWVRFLWRKSGVWKRTNHSYVAGFGPAAIAAEETRPVPVGE